MTQNGGEKFSSEVNSRLSELFGEKGPPVKTADDAGRNGPAPAAEKEPAPAVPSEKDGPTPDGFLPFRELKSILLSIEWEITDEIMRRLIDETEGLRQSFSVDPLIVSFLKLLGSVGKYIGNKKANAHPDSIRLLHSVYAQLETVLMSSSMTESEVKMILAGEVQKFKALKRKLMDQSVEATQRTIEPAARGEDRADTAAEEKAENSTQIRDTSPNLDLLSQRIDLIEQRMREEFKNLRTLLDTFRKRTT